MQIPTSKVASMNQISMLYIAFMCMFHVADNVLLSTVYDTQRKMNQFFICHNTDITFALH